MKRQLLLTAPATPHPFRRTVRQASVPPRDAGDNDLKLFVLAYTAFFVCFYTFIF
jgi:hypothetical protein